MATSVFLDYQPWQTLTSPTISNPTFTGQELEADGTAGAPSKSFTSEPTLGLWRSGAGTIQMEGALTAKTGTGTAVASTSGVLTTSTTQAGTTAVTTEETLWTYTLPANTLAVDGRGVRITVWGITAANANLKTFRLYFGATMIQNSGSVAQNAFAWQIRAEILRASATAQTAGGTNSRGSNDGSNATTAMLVTAPAETLSGAIVIKVTGINAVAAANDIVFRGAVVEAI